MQRTSLGRELLERVFYHLNLEEREYFGLKYLDVNSVCQWLDPLKEVKKQSKDKGEWENRHIFFGQLNMNAEFVNSSFTRLDTGW